MIRNIMFDILLFQKKVQKIVLMKIISFFFKISRAQNHSDTAVIKKYNKSSYHHQYNTLYVSSGRFVMFDLLSFYL